MQIRLLTEDREKFTVSKGTKIKLKEILNYAYPFHHIVLETDFC